MALDERDYMRKPVYSRTEAKRPWWQRITLPTVLAAIVAVAGAVSAVAWFLSDVSYITSFLPSREATLIVNINTASADELETLPGIGPTLAKLIIDGRPYATPDDLERVSGIGAKKLQSLRPYVKVEGDTEKSN